MIGAIRRKIKKVAKSEARDGQEEVSYKDFQLLCLSILWK